MPYLIYSFKQGTGSQQPPAGTVVIDGITTEGETLTANISSVTDPNGIQGVAYQWKRGASNISGATSSTYVLVSDDIGNTISVDVTVTDNYGDSQVLTGGPTAIVEAAFSFGYRSLAGSSPSDTIRGNDIVIDSNGDMIVVGTEFISGGSGDALIVKYNSDGSQAWQRQLVGNGEDQFHAVAVDSSNNIYAVGHTLSSGQGGSDALIAKYNSSGTLQWQKTLGRSGGAYPEYFEGVAVDTSGNIFAVGRGTDPAGQGYQCIIVKYNIAGGILWQRYYGPTSTATDQFKGVAATGDAYCVGSIVGTGGLIARYNGTTGSPSWLKIFSPGGEYDELHDIVVAGGAIYIVGSTRTLATGTYDIYVGKYNSTGTPVWHRTLRGSAEDKGFSITVSPNGYVYISGEINSEGAGNYDIFVAKFDASGVIQWQRTIGSTSADQGYNTGIQVDANDDIYITGHMYYAGRKRLALIKMPDVMTNLPESRGTITIDNSSLIVSTQGYTVNDGSTGFSSTSSMTAANGGLSSQTSSLTEDSSYW